MATGISWTDETWNPTIGCSKVSPGCAHCYAETLSKRPMMQRFGYTGLDWTPENAHLNVKMLEDRLSKPLSWKTPRMVFVNSMSDLFHELVPEDFIWDVYAIMAASSQHTFQVLTKRPERRLAMFGDPAAEQHLDEACDRLAAHMGWCHAGEWEWPLKNVWEGTSVENQHFAEVRIPFLVETPAAVRFLSCEPLLGPIQLAHAWLYDYAWGRQPRAGAFVDWVIVGGESGPGFRAMNPEWARDIRDQCQAADVAFFFKQSSGMRPGKGRLLDGREWHEFPQEVAA